MNFIFFLTFFALSLAMPVYAADQSKPLKGKDLETAQAMNDMYARHILTSTCMERQKTYFIPYGISDQEKSVRLNSYKKSCDCITDTILKSYSANDAIGYVTESHGSVAPQQSGSKTVKTVQSNQQREKFGKMTYMMNVDKENRKNCGFQK